MTHLVENAQVRTTAERDQQTITIATSLIVFVGVLAAGVVLGVFLNIFFELSDGLAEALAIGLFVAAGACALGYLIRHRR